MIDFHYATNEWQLPFLPNYSYFPELKPFSVANGLYVHEEALEKIQKTD